MGNIDNSKVLRIFGVAYPDSKFAVKPYGNGITDIEIDSKKFRVSYVDYFIEDLISLIKKQNLSKKFIKKLEEQ